MSTEAQYVHILSGPEILLLSTHPRNAYMFSPENLCNYCNSITVCNIAISWKQAQHSQHTSNMLLHCDVVVYISASAQRKTSHDPSNTDRFHLKPSPFPIINHCYLSDSALFFQYLTKISEIHFAYYHISFNPLFKSKASFICSAPRKPQRGSFLYRSFVMKTNMFAE